VAGFCRLRHGDETIPHAVRRASTDAEAIRGPNEVFRVIALNMKSTSHTNRTPRASAKTDDHETR